MDDEIKNAIVGVLYFYPSIVYETLGDTFPCIQDPKEVDKITPKLNEIKSLPAFSELSNEHKILLILCMHVVGLNEMRRKTAVKSYTSTGIGEGLMKQLVSWARRKYNYFLTN